MPKCWNAECCVVTVLELLTTICNILLINLKKKKKSANAGTGENKQERGREREIKINQIVSTESYLWF